MFIFGVIVGAIAMYFFMSPSATKAAKDSIKGTIEQHKELNKPKE